MSAALDRVKELEASLKAAREAAVGEMAAAKQTEMGTILEHLKENDITIGELAVFARISGSKYSNGTDTWSGKGKKPEWIVKALAAGKKLEDFATKKAEAEATA